MGRIPRKYSLVETGYFHIIARGNNRKEIFKETADYLKWKDLFLEYKNKYDAKVLAYCLMPNHYHLLLESGPPLSKLMGTFNTQYAKYFNQKYNESGHFFGGRFKSFLVADDPYLITLIRYIHNNPVRANLVENPLDYEYSSLREYNNDNSFIDAKAIEKLIDKSVMGTPMAQILC